MEVAVLAGSVLDAGAEAIVNAANTELRHGGGVARAIAVAAGPALEAESRRVAPCPLGQAVATGPGRLGCRLVLHVPTLDWTTGRRATPAELADGVRTALELAAAAGCRSVAFPLLGAGIAGLGARAACRALAAAFAHAAASGPVPERVIVCAFTEDDQAAARAVFGSGDAAGAEK